MADFQLQLGLLKFEDVRTAIKNYFRDVKDIEYYEGNNFSILIDALSYLQEMMAYQLSHQANNVYSRTSTDRKTAVENAYKLGYNPHRKIPNTITCSGFETAPVTDVICYGQRSGLPYLIRSGSITATQEETKKIYFTTSGLANQKITIPTINISNTELIVKVDDVIYTKFDIYDQIPDSDSEIYFLNESESDEFYTDITFGNGILGKIPEPEFGIEITYYETFGKDGNDEIGLDQEDPTYFAGITFVSSDCGKDHEDLDSIKINSSKYHSSRGRLVTKKDYENYFKNQADAVDVSENINGVNYYYAGNIYVSLVPSTIINDLANLQTELNKTSGYSDLKLLDWKDNGLSIANIGSLSSENINDDLENKKIIGTNIIYSSPSYIYCDVTPKAESNISGYKFSSVDLKQYRNSLMQHCLINLNRFESDFRIDYLSKQLFEQTDLIKSVKYDINYYMIFNNDNITDTYSMILPDNFVSTNEDYFNLDNNFLGNYYNRSNQPLNRHVLYSVLNNKTESQTNLTFTRYLYSGVSSVLNDNYYSDALIFDIKSGEIENKQSIPVFSDSVSYIIKIESDLNIYATTTIGNNTSSSFKIGSLVRINDSSYYVVFDSFTNGLDTDWNDYFNYSITKLQDDNIRVVIKLYGNNVIGESSGKPSISISSKLQLGTIYTENNRINIEKIDLGSLTVKNLDNDTLLFQLANETKFKVTQSNGNYSIVTTDDNGSPLNGLTNVKPSIINSNQLYISEKQIDNTTIGEYDSQNSKILFYPLLGSVNNSEINNIIDLNQYLVTDNNILTAGTKYRMSILPKYEIDTGVLKYKYDFNKKPGLYKFININTLRNV